MRLLFGTIHSTGVNSMKQIWKNRYNVCNLWAFKSNSLSCLVILNEGKLLNSNSADLLIEDRKRANAFFCKGTKRTKYIMKCLDFNFILNN